MTLKLALVGGPMYDGLYDLFADHDVEIVVHADHPTLNRRVAELLAAGERIDVLSTHGKYAPSQAQWLRPLDELLDPDVIDALSPKAVDLCRVDGRVCSVPRLIDVRILWSDASRYPDGVPDTWDDVVATVEAGIPFGMPGRESGLFGTFFELVAGAGGRLLADGVSLDRDIAADAIETLRRIAAGVPDTPSWHYDGVDAALLDGTVAAAAAWPGSTAQIRDCAIGLTPSPYPAGPARRVTYSGCHSWAIPTTCGDLDGAVGLVTELCGMEAHTKDAASGSVCANVEAFAAVTPADAVDARRLELTRDAIAEQMITYPALARFPEIEDAGWMALRSVFIGDSTVTDAVDAIDTAITTVATTEALT